MMSSRMNIKKFSLFLNLYVGFFFHKQHSLIIITIKFCLKKKWFYIINIMTLYFMQNNLIFNIFFFYNIHFFYFTIPSKMFVQIYLYVLHIFQKCKLFYFIGYVILHNNVCLNNILFIIRVYLYYWNVL